MCSPALFFAQPVSGTYVHGVSERRVVGMSTTHTLSMALTRRNRRTLAAVTRAMVPSGGAVTAGADDLDLPRKIADEVDTYPRFAHNQVRLLLFGIEHYPLISGHARRFSSLPSKAQVAYLRKTAHHKSALRRLVVSYLKQIVLGAFVSQPEVERVVGYQYECVKALGRPEDGAKRLPPEKEQVHH